LIWQSQRTTFEFLEGVAMNLTLTKWRSDSLTILRMRTIISMCHWRSLSLHPSYFIHAYLINLLYIILLFTSPEVMLCFQVKEKQTCCQGKEKKCVARAKKKRRRWVDA
jgi:hypothetical protein